MKHYPTRRHDGQQIAIPRGLSGVSGQGAVLAVGATKLVEVGLESDSPVHSNAMTAMPPAIWMAPGMSSTPRTMCPRVVT